MVTTLFYIHDPMCSWCYAFAPSLHTLQKELPDFIRIKKIVGGLAPDTTNPMPLELQQKIQQTWRRIEQTVPNMQFNCRYSIFEFDQYYWLYEEVIVNAICLNKLNEKVFLSAKVISEEDYTHSR